MNKNISLPISSNMLIQIPWYVPLLLAIILGIGIGVAIKELGQWALLLIPGVILLVGVFLFREVALPTFIFVIYTNLSANMITFYDAPSIAKPFVALLGLILFIRIVFLVEEVRGLILPIAMLSLYTLVAAVSLTYVADFDAGYDALVEYMKIAIYSILVVAFLQRPSTLNNVVWVLLFAGILMGSISIYQYFTGTTSNVYWGFGQSYASDNAGTGYRVGGAVGDPNYYAMILAILVPLAVDRFVRSKSTLMKFFAIWALIVSVPAILYTYSRGGFLSLCVAGVIMAVQYKLRPVTILIGVTLFFVMSQFLPANYKDRILTLSYFLPQSSSQLEDDSIRGRTSANLAAWEMFKDYPLTGVGISNYATLYFAYARPLGLDTTAADAEQPHNLYFQILAERGLIGFSVFIIIMFITFRNLYRSKKIFEDKQLFDLAGISSALIVSMIIYMFSSTFLHDTFIRYFWILMGIAWSIPNLAENEDNNKYQIVP